MKLEKKEGDRFEKLVELPDADKKIYYKVGGYRDTPVHKAEKSLAEFEIY